MTIFRLITLGLVSVSLLAACNAHQPAHDHPHEHANTERSRGYVPGLGALMAQSAQRHAKIWLAAQAGNWALADYEAEELEEVLEAITEYHPTHKHVPLPLPDMLAKTVSKPLASLQEAIRNKDMTAFTGHYDQLTAACNSCHEQTGFAFNRLTRPTFNPYPNQLFELPR